MFLFLIFWNRVLQFFKENSRVLSHRRIESKHTIETFHMLLLTKSIRMIILILFSLLRTHRNVWWILKQAQHRSYYLNIKRLKTAYFEARFTRWLFPIIRCIIVIYISASQRSQKMIDYKSDLTEMCNS